MDTAYFTQLINDKQATGVTYDKAQAAYDKLATTLSIQALDTPLFPSKKDMGIKLPASNDTERKQAIEYVLAHNEEILMLATELNLCRRIHESACENLKAAVLLAELEIARSKMVTV